MRSDWREVRGEEGSDMVAAGQELTSAGCGVVKEDESSIC